MGNEPRVGRQAAAILAVVPPLRALRRLKGMTQEDLAGAAGVSVGTISRLEKGHRPPRPHTMLRIARVLGVPIARVDEFVEPRPRPTDESS
jgi:transcriptional regulator with XRE-family HTH domain